MKRTSFARLVAGAALAGIAPAPSRSLAAESPALAGHIAQLEAVSGGRLGVAVIDLATGRLTLHRGNERFPMCSTFKLVAVAFVLQRVDRGAERLSRRVFYHRNELLDNSPVTGERLERGMTIGELCAAALDVSDNTAANLLLASFGGPPALTAFARSIGDHATRFDRLEPELNTAIPGDPRDTTTPVAMAGAMLAIFDQPVLSAASRALLVGWLRRNETGDARLRAGLPHDWVAADKTGSGAHGTSNDVALLQPPGRAAIIVTSYITNSLAGAGRRDAALAGVGRAIAEDVSLTIPSQR